MRCAFIKIKVKINIMILSDNFYFKDEDIKTKLSICEINHEPQVYCEHNKRLNGRGYSGCSSCINFYKKNIKKIATEVWIKIKTDFFIERSNKKHASVYDYTHVKYQGNKTPVEIICKKHGSFFQRPNNHMMGEGCGKCFENERRGKFRLQTHDQIIKKFIDIHGNLYNYSKFVYVNSTTKGEIICNRCEESFMMNSEHHILRGQGCKTCITKLNAKKQRTDSDIFFSECTSIHGGIYDYINSVYITSHEDITFRCTLCNQYCTMKAHSHKNACAGCTCTKNKTEKQVVLPFLIEKFDSGNVKIKHMGSKLTKGIGRMDFVIEKDGNIAGFIEVDGRQHGLFRCEKHMETSWINRVGESSDKIQKRDLDKHIKAESFGYKVIRIEQEYVWKNRLKLEHEWKDRLQKSVYSIINSKKLELSDMFICDNINVYEHHLCYVHEKRKLEFL